MRAHLGLHLERLGLVLRLEVLDVILDLLDFELLRLDERLETLRLLRRLGVLRLALAALRLERFLHRLLFLRGDVLRLSHALVRGDLVDAAVILEGLELLVELRHLRLERLERLRGGIGGAVVLRALHLPRLLLGGEERLELGDPVVQFGGALLHLGGARSRRLEVLAAALLLRGNRRLGGVAGLVRRFEGERVRLLLLLQLRGVFLDHAVHLDAVRLAKRLLDARLAELRLLDDQRAHRLLVLRLHLEVFRLLSLERGVEEVDLLPELVDFGVARRELHTEVSVRVGEPLREVRSLRRRLVARTLQLGDLAHLLGGALELRVFERLDALAELLHLVRAAGHAGGGGGEAHAEDAVLHARLLGVGLFLVPVDAHGVELRPDVLDGHRVGLDGGGEHALRLAKRLRRLLGRLERGEGFLQVVLEVLLLPALAGELLLELLAQPLLLGERGEGAREALLHRLRLDAPRLDVLLHDGHLAPHRLRALLHLRPDVREFALRRLALLLLRGELGRRFGELIEGLLEFLLRRLGLDLPHLHLLDGGDELARRGGDLDVLLVRQFLHVEELLLLHRELREALRQALLRRLGLDLPDLHLLDGRREPAVHGARFRLDRHQTLPHLPRLVLLVRELKLEMLSLRLGLLLVLGRELDRPRLPVRGFLRLGEHGVALGVLLRPGDRREQLLEIQRKAESRRVLRRGEPERALLRGGGIERDPPGLERGVLLLLERVRANVQGDAEPERVRGAARQGVIGNGRQERLLRLPSRATHLRGAALGRLLRRQARLLRRRLLRGAVLGGEALGVPELLGGGSVGGGALRRRNRLAAGEVERLAALRVRQLRALSRLRFLAKALALHDLQSLGGDARGAVAVALLDAEEEGVGLFLRRARRRRGSAARLLLDEGDVRAALGRAHLGILLGVRSLG